MRCKAGGICRRHDLPTQDGLHHVSAALEGDVVELDAHALRDVLHRQVRAGQHTRGAVAELARVGLGPGHEIGPGLDGRLGGHHHPEGIAGDAQDVGDVLDRVPADLGGVGQAEHAQRDLRQGVAVRLGLLQGLRRQRAAGAGAVLDHHGLPEQLGRVFRQSAHGQVGGAARREGDHQLDGLHRPGALGAQARRDAGGNTGHQQGSSLHGNLPVDYGCCSIVKQIRSARRDWPEVGAPLSRAHCASLTPPHPKRFR